MASIKISELRPAGSELFQDSESFLNELNSQDMGGVIGGLNVNSVASQSVGSIASAAVTGGIITQSVSVSVSGVATKA
ncbi:MAG: hypothetical protein HWQ41_26770 [Nostoc sp. NOS(2021)]|uniref:hypothetical protein n=1 Tax=Nostoc sp. NOS(2021) TaxID=2815407 RepID=UPI0025F8ABDD|nr:hypothetical protein [Nostoc sp. NOS(2021)]MBN3898741.1 hypothetical protein [Nostoc sp. NOS(2021)]